MNKFTSIAAILLVLLSFNNASAKIWRVNNTPGVNANFTTVQAAHDAASAGDTIHVEASATAYGSLNITKQIAVIGNGYLLTLPDTGLQANTNAVSLGIITFSAGSANSVIEGVTFNNVIYVEDQNITIRRCYVGYVVYIYSNNFSFYNNFVYQYGITNQVASLSGLNFYNNIFYYGGSLSLSNTCTGSIYNNDFYSGSISVYNFQINNNIMYGGSFAVNNNVYFNNISTATLFGNANGNQQNVSIASLITQADGYQYDTYWKLAAGSPAIGAGYGGVDCGATGGPNPYKLGGIPDVPTIYSLTVPPVGTSTISVTISTKSNN